MADNGLMLMDCLLPINNPFRGKAMRKTAAFLCVSLIFSSQPAFAVGSGGFENASFSAKSIAQSNAVVAQADEPAAISYNPAGITQLKGFQVQTSQDFIGANTFYSGANDNTTQSGGTLNYVPTAYATINPGKILNDRLTIGVGSDAPFGLANKYDSTHPVARYVGFENAIKMFTVKPVVAVKLHDKLSIGAGPIFYRVFDVSTRLAYPNQLLAGGLPDGQLRAGLRGNAWGWQLGALAKPHEQHHFGFYFRSPTHVDLKGRVTVEGAGGGVDALGPAFFQTAAYGKMALPLNMTWAYAFRPTPKLKLEADFGYTRWSIHRRLYINTASVNPATHDILLAAVGKQDKDYSDGYSLHLGSDYQVNQKWNVMGGMLFYWASIPADHWNVVVPDSNRLGFTLGTGYSITDWLKLEISYLSSFNLRRKIDNSTLDALGQTMDGRYFSYIHGLYITLTYKWEEAFGDKKYEKKDEKEAKPIIIPSRKPEGKGRSQAMEQELAYREK
jgi:long-chain fatty acid transport protein